MTTVSTAPLPLAGRRIQIAGSASASTDPAVVRYGHEVIARLVTNIMTAGGGIVGSSETGSVQAFGNAGAAANTARMP